MQTVDILIVGAGPAGLAAGMAAAHSPEQSVCVLEGNDTAGRKFLLSGSGQCNLTHGGAIGGFLNRYGDGKKARFVKPALFSFDNKETVRFFEDRGVPLDEREDGKIFPRSLKSSDPLRVLLDEMEKRGGRLAMRTLVESIDRSAEGFCVQTQDETFHAKRLILATGGCSYPATGSRGAGFEFARRLGHRIVEPAPALAPVYVRDYPFAGSAGFSLRHARVVIRRNGKTLHASRGDVLLTHHGLSGPGILDPSRYVEPGDTLEVALRSEEERNASLADLLYGKKTLKNSLAPLGLPERLLVRLLETLDLPPDLPAAETNRDRRRRLESALNGFPFVVERLGGWNEAMATRGGVALEEVDRQTMQSRLAPGLFFCGEVLDVDGDTGGYNIQFALSSGFLAGKRAASPC